MTAPKDSGIGFIGGGNMASAIIGGLLRNGVPAHQIQVVDPYAPTREQLRERFGIAVHASPTPTLAALGLLVWAVKPQQFKEAAAGVAAHRPDALHVSVAAGINSDSIALWLESERVVRAMPNTPALIGKGITALYARPGASASDRTWAAEVMGCTGALLWLETENLLDAVTALSGSGPAYMFYFMEAMTDAGVQMGLARDHANQLAVATFIGAGELARSSSEPPSTLRERVTSKGGTTHAAITRLEASQVKERFMDALFAAHRRAGELGREFGGQSA